MTPAPGDYSPLVGGGKSLGHSAPDELRIPTGVTSPDTPRDWPGVGVSGLLSDVHSVVMHGSWDGHGRVAVGHSRGKRVRRVFKGYFGGGILES